MHDSASWSQRPSVNVPNRTIASLKLQRSAGSHRVPRNVGRTILTVGIFVRPVPLRVLSIAGLFVLSACGGGGGGGGAAIPGGPVSTPTPSPAPTQAPPGTATFTLANDSTSSITSAKRRPRYVSPKTASIAIVLNGAGSATILNLADTAHCDASGKCSISLQAPAGNDTFLVSAYDAQNGGGNLLSRATVQATIPPSGTAVIPAVLNGAVASVTVTPANAMPVLHQITTDALTVIAKDASNSTIVGPGGYLYPITLTNSDTSGHTSLTKTTLNGPGDTAALQYDGGYAAGTVTATALGVAAPGTATFSPSITTTETAVPSGNAASRIFAGPDGALWFISSAGTLDRITTDGSISEFSIASWNATIACTGPDGAIWIGAQSRQSASLAIIRRNTDGSFTTYPTGTAASSIASLITGSDGNLWFSAQGVLYRSTTSGAVTQQHLKDSNGNPIVIQLLVAGPDGAIWFTAFGALGRYDIASGAVTIYPVLTTFGGAPATDTPGTIVLGPDSRLYFNGIGSLFSSDAAGNIVTVLKTIAGLGNAPLTFAPDGGLWLSAGATLAGNPQWGRVSGTTEVPVQGSTGMPNVFPPAAVNSMVTGPDQKLWYARGSVIGRMVP